MSQENIEIVHRFNDAVNRGDREAAAADIHPEVEWRTMGGPLLGVEAVFGRDEVIRFVFEQIPEGIEGFRAVVGEVSELPDGEAFVVGHYEGRGVASGVDLRVEVTQIYRFAAGMIVFFQDFSSRAEALEAAGLSE
jgi:ketosteroid isomerase-like protein